MEWSAYDLEAWHAAQTWRNPKQTLWTQITERINNPLETVANLALDNPIGQALQLAVQGVVVLLNDAAAWTVRDKAIFAEYRGNGYTVEGLSDIRPLPLESVDKVVGYLGGKYRLWAAAEGAATGSLGLAGLAADIPLMISLNLRCICEFATYYGFDIETEHERAYAVHVLSMSSSSSMAAKQSALGQLNKIAMAVARKQTWAELERILGVQWIKQIAESLGIRLTKAKLGQVVPLMGAVVGGGVNGYFADCTIKAAGHLYRERFLMRQYGGPPPRQ